MKQKLHTMRNLQGVITTGKKYKILCSFLDTQEDIKRRKILKYIFEDWKLENHKKNKNFPSMCGICTTQNYGQ